eukprot:355619-Chlamydomonas_euryale.AAC.3
MAASCPPACRRGKRRPSGCGGSGGGIARCCAFGALDGRKPRLPSRLATRGLRGLRGLGRGVVRTGSGRHACMQGRRRTPSLFRPADATWRPAQGRRLPSYEAAAAPAARTPPAWTHPLRGQGRPRARAGARWEGGALQQQPGLGCTIVGQDLEEAAPVHVQQARMHQGGTPNEKQHPCMCSPPECNTEVTFRGGASVQVLRARMHQCGTPTKNMHVHACAARQTAQRGLHDKVGSTTEVAYYSYHHERGRRPSCLPCRWTPPDGAALATAIDKGKTFSAVGTQK